MKKKQKTTHTLSESFQNPRDKSQKGAKSIPLIAHFPGMVHFSKKWRGSFSFMDPNHMHSNVIYFSTC